MRKVKKKKAKRKRKVKLYSFHLNSHTQDLKALASDPM